MTFNIYSFAKKFFTKIIKRVTKNKRVNLYERYLKNIFQIFLLKFYIDNNVIRKHNFRYYFLFSMK